MAREVLAGMPEEAVTVAMQHIRAGWEGGKHGPLSVLTAVAVWPAGFWDRLHQIPINGHTFYSDCEDAQRKGLALELAVARAPRRIRSAVALK